MDETDRGIVDMIQTDFPIHARPYDEIGKKLGLSEGEVIERLRSLKERRIIRRIGGLMEPRRIGYVSALVAAKVDPAFLESVAAKINSYVGVTHNYYREHEYNVWFTLIAHGGEEHEKILADIHALPGVLELRSLPATRIFKLKVNFKAGEDDGSE